MTSKEVYDKYLVLFKIIVSDAGDKTNNLAYKNVYSILEHYDEVIQTAIKEEVPLNLFVTLCISLIVYEINYKGVVSDWTKMSNELMDDFWERYLKKPTRSFTSKYGLKAINELEYGVVISSLIDKK